MTVECRSNSGREIGREPPRFPPLEVTWAKGSQSSSTCSGDSDEQNNPMKVAALRKESSCYPGLPASNVGLEHLRAKLRVLVQPTEKADKPGRHGSILHGG